MEQTNNLFDLQLDAASNSYLGETARWAKFLSIVGFVACALAILAGIFLGSTMSNMMGASMGSSALGGTMIAVIYIAISLLYFFPCLYLYRFASNMQHALRAGDGAQLQVSLKNLKSCFKFLGVLTIVILSLYGLALIGGFAAAAFAV